VQSNPQTEDNVKASGFDWVIGRNGICNYPEVEYLGSYKAKGEIAICAGDGLCGYKTCSKPAFACAHRLTDPKHKGQLYKLHGLLITQAMWARQFGDRFGAVLLYCEMTIEAYRANRIADAG
jgi:NAD(P)H dehydrogenase (quinone)